MHWISILILFLGVSVLSSYYNPNLYFACCVVCNSDSMYIILQGVIDVLCEACEQLKWKAPSKIQREAIPVALQGMHDIYSNPVAVFLILQRKETNDPFLC